jgi:N-methylhydantoinase B
VTGVAPAPTTTPGEEPVVSPVLLEIIRHRLNNINDDAASTLKRVSGSQIAVEASDLNTVIMAADGRVVACGRYVLIQVASMHLVVSYLLEHYGDNPGIGPGDQFITNDPYVGTLHQPDVVLAAPIFVDGTLVAWCASVVHQSDVGGPTPGGITYDARSIFDEAIPMAPIKIVEGGRLRNDVEREYLIRSRTPELNALDLAGQIAANRHAATQVEQVCRRYGTTTLTAALAQLLAAGERQLRRRLRGLPDGRWRHTAYVLFHDRNAPAGQRDRNYAVRLTMTKEGDRLELDFTGSDPQAPGAINATRPALVNFAMAGLLIYLCNGMPWVPGGVWPVVDIVSKEGTVVHARWPAGVAMSTSSTGQAVRVCVNACVARLLEGSDELAALLMASCQSAGAGACTIAGIDDDGRPFATMTLDDISGGGGARSDADGADSSGFTTSPGAAIANVEVNESYLPIRYLARRELVDSGGPGTFRGGVGTVQVLAPYRMQGAISVLSFGQGLQHPAAIGVAGGEPGGQSGFAILPAEVAERLVAERLVAERLVAEIAGSETRVPLPTAGMTMATGQVELVVSQGGGGYGDPLEREPDLVVADVAEGLVSPDAARRVYGVVMEAAPGYPRLDPGATASRRDAIRGDRLGGRVPRPATRVAGRRFSEAFAIVPATDEAGDDSLACRRCGVVLCRTADNLYDHLIVHIAPTAVHAPLGLRYDGSDEFVIRTCYCPSCGRQVDVMVGRADEPILRAIEPLEAGSTRV